jgi:hypothetical protein
VSETDVERDLVGGRVFGRSDGSQSASLLARSTSKGHHQKERAPKESVNNADGCEHANALQTLALESSQQFVEIAVVIRIARHGWTGYRCHHSARFVFVLFFFQSSSSSSSSLLSTGKHFARFVFFAS